MMSPLWMGPGSSSFSPSTPMPSSPCIITFAFLSECPTIGKSSRGKGLTMQPTVSYKVIWHSNGKAGTEGQEQSELSLNTSPILVSNSDSRSETNAHYSGNKTKMISSSLVQSRESLVSSVGSVQTDSKSWLGLVPGVSKLVRPSWYFPLPRISVASPTSSSVSIVMDTSWMCVRSESADASDVSS